MRGKQAKRLRRDAYGELSLKNPRQYYTDTNGSVRNVDGPRTVYKSMKKDHRGR